MGAATPLVIAWPVWNFFPVFLLWFEVWGARMDATSIWLHNINIDRTLNRLGTYVDPRKRATLLKDMECRGSVPLANASAKCLLLIFSTDMQINQSGESDAPWRWKRWTHGNAHRPRPPAA